MNLHSQPLAPLFLVCYTVHLFRGTVCISSRVQVLPATHISCAICDTGYISQNSSYEEACWYEGDGRKRRLEVWQEVQLAFGETLWKYTSISVTISGLADVKILLDGCWSAPILC